MAIYHRDVPQGELEWVQLRIGIPTASEFDNLMTPLFAARKGEGVETYLCKKLAESIQGHALPGFSSHATEQGEILEDEAKPWFSFHQGVEVERCGFVTTDDKSSGCSPDGLIGEDEGLEIKCPYAETHVRYLRANSIPKEYAAQVYGSLFVTGRQRWNFLPYRRGFPKLIVTVERDEEIMTKIGAILSDFRATFSAALQQLKELRK